MKLATVPHAVFSRSDSFDLGAVLNQVGEAVAYVDAHWVVRFCNDTYLADLGMAREHVLGRTPFEYIDGFERSIFYEAFEHCRVDLQPKTRIAFSVVLNRWLMVRVFPLAGGMLMLANDATESVVKQYQLAQQVLKDPLTGVANKLAMERDVVELVAAGTPFCFAVFGLERFAEVNETYGYSTGDMVLMEVASSLQSATQSAEALYRVSGNEFAVLRSGSQYGGAERAAALMEAVRKPITFGGARIVLGACAGTVASPKDGTSYDVLLKRAGLALREARKGGSGTKVPYRSELELASQVRSLLEADLRVALDGSQFLLLVQPKVSLSTGAVIGGEALIRWAHPHRGVLAPGVFLGAAHEIDAMVAIDRWVLRQSLKFCAALAAQGHALPISINLSVDSLADAYLADRVRDALEEAHVEPGMLEVEIPEGALMRDVKASAKVLTELHEMGVKISIDDFGTGYSSFAYLAQFPVETLKIDRSFVKDIGSNKTSRKIVEGIVRLAHSLSLQVVAEGAEEAEQVTLLRKMRCDALQGYFIAKPLSWTDFQAFVASHPPKKQPDPLSI